MESVKGLDEIHGLLRCLKVIEGLKLSVDFNILSTLSKPV